MVNSFPTYKAGFRVFLMTSVSIYSLISSCLALSFLKRQISLHYRHLCLSVTQCIQSKYLPTAYHFPLDLAYGTLDKANNFKIT